MKDHGYIPQTPACCSSRLPNLAFFVVIVGFLVGEFVHVAVQLFLWRYARRLGALLLLVKPPLVRCVSVSSSVLSAKHCLKSLHFSLTRFRSLARVFSPHHPS